MTASLTLPRLHLYPERSDSRNNWQQRAETALIGAGFVVTNPLRRARVARFIGAVNGHQAACSGLDDAGLKQCIEDIRHALTLGGYRDKTVAKAYALIREVAWREIGMFHYDVQIQGGFVMLHGAIAELETGEGKTLTATLAAATAALSGIPVHVITVNDYLAKRDRDLMAPIYQALGLSVGLVVSGLSPEERRAAYAADITYATNKEIAFDYLRDRMALGYDSNELRRRLTRLFPIPAQFNQPVMRGLHFAIVDEADSILIDEARTPLIISSPSDPKVEQARAETALKLAPLLKQNHDFIQRRDNRQIELTAAGKASLAQHAKTLAGPWHGALFREEQVRHALSALLLFHRDEHYLVRDDKVEIIDEYTGRVMPDRSWSEGLHQMVEVKEGCTVTGQTIPLARITYQRFFRRYRMLTGMTGTAREAAVELRTVYRLPVVTIPPNRPLARIAERTKVYRTADQKWREIAERAKALQAAGVPLLIGTRSVAASEIASHYLTEAGVRHKVLNADQDQHEAEIVAEAGQDGSVTVATNMAGRGVDIRLGSGVADRGGLYVIMSEMHDSKRIDRQLLGRCARQGEPGRVETLLSLEDALLEEAGLRRSRLGSMGLRRRALFRRAQRTLERRYATARRDLMRWDGKLSDALAFSGRLE